MKKLLSILTTLGITGTVFNGVNLITAASFNNAVNPNYINNEIKYAKAMKIQNENVEFIAFTEDGNIFMSTKSGLFYLKYNNTKIEKILGINELVKVHNFTKDKLYFGTETSAYILKNGEKIATKIKNIANFKINSIDVINNNVYFGTNFGAYILKNNETTARKIANMNVEYVIGTKHNNKIYFNTAYGIYVVTYGDANVDETIATKINDTNFFHIGEPIINGKEIYFAGFFYTYKLIDGETNITRVADLDEIPVHSLAIAANNNIYFGTSQGLYVIQAGQTSAIKIGGINTTITAMKIIKNDVYFGTDFGAYILKNGETIAEQLDQIVDKISLIDGENNNLYFAGENDKIYHLKNKIISIIQLNVNKIDGIKKFYFDKTNKNVYIQQNFNNIFLLIDKEKIQKDEIFEKWYKFLAPDELKIKFSYYQLANIIEKFENKKQPDFIRWLNQIIKSIPRADHSGAGGSISDDDINIITNVIYSHFANIYTKYQQMKEQDELTLSTTTNSYWDEGSLMITRNL